MKIGMIGDGSIGRCVARHLADRQMGLRALLVRPERLETPDEAQGLRVSRVADLPEDLDLMVDCAGHSALTQYGADILERGIDLVTVSIGALADVSLYAALERAAQKGGARLHLASGAIGALDCLRAARVGGLEEVHYVGRKSPSGWNGTPAQERFDLGALTEPAVHFKGSARRAALDYPKNANVAAAVALAGVGFDETKVTLIADPTVISNIHELHARGSFGAFSLRIEGRALPDSARSSALAAMSVVSAIERQCASITI